MLNSRSLVGIVLGGFVLLALLTNLKAETPKNSDTISNEKQFFRFSYPEPGMKLNGTIKAKGTHNYNVSAHIWIVLEDSTQGNYLQQPNEVSVSDGTWGHNNISLGGGIQSINAFCCDEVGHKEFLSVVKNKNYGRIEIPPGCKKIASVSITN